MIDYLAKLAIVFMCVCGVILLSTATCILINDYLNIPCWVSLLAIVGISMASLR